MRQRGEEFTPEELEYKRGEILKDPATGEELVNDPEDLLFGLNKLMAALETMNGQSTLDKRGELRTQFICTSVAVQESGWPTMQVGSGPLSRTSRRKGSSFLMVKLDGGSKKNWG